METIRAPDRFDEPMTALTVLPDPSTLAVFVPASVALILAPGPDSLYVLSRGITDGSLGGIAAALGTCTGILIHTIGAVLGLSVLFHTSALAYTAVKYVGAAYLLYLGVQAIRDKDEFDVTIGDTEHGARENYLRGVLIKVLNPKVALFFLAFLPQFVPPGANTSVQMLTLGLLFSALGTAYLAGVAVLSSSVRRILVEYPPVSRALRWATGSVLVGFGLSLALDERVSS